MIKTYLGDGAYVAFDGYAFHITAENGITETDRVVLGPEEFVLLVHFAARVGVQVGFVAPEEEVGS